MIGVVIPAHNEERLIGECLDSVLVAAEHPSLKDETVEIRVVLDHCSDNTGAVVSAKGVAPVDVCFRNVGKARAVGAEHLLEAGARWLAFTDADTVVPPDWLARQIEFGASADRVRQARRSERMRSSPWCWPDRARQRIGGYAVAAWARALRPASKRSKKSTAHRLVSTRRS